MYFSKITCEKKATFAKSIRRNREKRWDRHIVFPLATLDHSQTDKSETM